MADNSPEIVLVPCKEVLSKVNFVIVNSLLCIAG